MRPRYWIITTISLSLGIMLALVAINVCVDPYGLFRSTRGRHLPVLGDYRVAKYLLSMRYVPENFNALLAGASVAANWDVSAIEHFRVYNESLNGGNIVEEKALIEATLERPGIRVVFLLVHPALTAGHEFHTVDLKPDLRLSALGSMSLWDAYKDMLKIWLGGQSQTFDFAGTETLLEFHREMNLHMKAMWDAPEFAVDSVALQAYLDLVANLRLHHVRIVFVVPPTSERLLRTKRAPFQRYVDRMRASLGDKDLWIDFMSTESQDLGLTSEHFSDGVHLMPEGTKLVVAYINTSTRRWVADRHLPDGSDGAGLQTR